jgi:hypothetical protein
VKPSHSKYFEQKTEHLESVFEPVSNPIVTTLHDNTENPLQESCSNIEEGTTVINSWYYNSFVLLCAGASDSIENERAVGLPIKNKLPLFAAFGVFYSSFKIFEGFILFGYFSFVKENNTSDRKFAFLVIFTQLIIPFLKSVISVIPQVRNKFDVELLFIICCLLILLIIGADFVKNGYLYFFL